MKSTGMDANREVINYRLTSVLWVFLMLILLGRPTLVFTQDTSGPTATIKILPEYTTAPREGDSVTLECEISSIQRPDYVLWARSIRIQYVETFIVDETGLTAHTDNRFSVSPLQVVNSTAALFSHKITIDPVQQSDQGYYQCYVKRHDSVIAQSAETLSVLHPGEFPVCFPNGPATVTIGSSLSCMTLSNTRIPIVSDTEMQTATNDGWVTSPTNAGGSPGQELTRTVTNSDHGNTFQCFSIYNGSAMALACKIGPLVVVSKTTGSPVPETTGTGTVNTTMIITGPDKQQSAGLSGADIAGIVIGVILLIIIIAVHTLCCRCNPKRWMYAKSYPFNVGSSLGTSRERGDTVRTQPDTELGNSEPQTNNLYSGVQAPTENDTGTTSSTTGNLQPAPTPDPWISEQPDPQSNEPKPNPPAVYAQVNKTTPETGTSDPINPQPTPSVINAQGSEKAPEDDEELLKENNKGSSKLQKVKNVERFGQNRNCQVARPPKPEPVVIYAELDLQETGNDEVRQPPSDSHRPTIYAQINH